MIVHVLFFRLQPSLDAAQRDALVGAFERALSALPTIKRARVGRRRTIGRPYEQAMREDYSFAAMLEFTTVDDLQAYIEHPAHVELATTFFASVETSLVYDFEMEDSREIRTLFGDLLRPA